MISCSESECYFNHEGICCFDEIDFVENEEPELLEVDCKL